MPNIPVQYGNFLEVDEFIEQHYEILGEKDHCIEALPPVREEEKRASLIDICMRENLVLHFRLRKPPNIKILLTYNRDTKCWEEMDQSTRSCTGKSSSALIDLVLLHYIEKSSFPISFQNDVKDLVAERAKWRTSWHSWNPATSRDMDEVLKKTFLYCHGSITKDEYLTFANTRPTVKNFMMGMLVISGMSLGPGLLFASILALANPAISLFAALLYLTVPLGLICAFAGLLGYIQEYALHSLTDCVKKLASNDYLPDFGRDQHDIVAEPCASGASTKATYGIFNSSSVKGNLTQAEVGSEDETPTDSLSRHSF